MYFLATTAIEEFWDTSKPILFLGDWCRRYSRRSFWEQLGGEVIRHPWQDRGKYREAYSYVNALYERLLPVLGGALNEVHGENHNNRYWAIIIGPFLFHYIHIIYDRYLLLKTILDKYQDITTIGLSEESFVVPLNTIDFINSVCDDPYNLQLCTKILSAIGKSFPRKNLEITPLKRANNGGMGSACAIFKKSIKEALNAAALAFQDNRQIILKCSNFDLYTTFRLIYKTKGRVWPCFEEDICLSEFQTDRRKRKKLGDLGFERDEFESVMQNMLPFEIPQCYIEGYKIIIKEVEKKYPKNCQAIMSANGWFRMEAFKQWAAASSEEGKMLIGAQHGGGYGSLACLPFENYELSVTDRFYSWGWEQEHGNSRIVPMPATKLAGRKAIGACNDKEGIVLAVTGTSRYFYRFEGITNYVFDDYISWQIRFIEAVSPDLKNKIRFRAYAEDYGWDHIQRLKDHNCGVTVETWKVPLVKCLKNCRIYVCDNLSTTYLEALSADKPTILFWNPDIFQLRTEAQPYYDLLREAGILHHSPESAASALNAAYRDAEGWWNAPERQAARKRFCHRFGRTSPDAIDQWAEELKDILQNRSIGGR
jgi:putative transferase (TIGR04331 family)